MPRLHYPPRLFSPLSSCSPLLPSRAHPRLCHPHVCASNSCARLGHCLPATTAKQNPGRRRLFSAQGVSHCGFASRKRDGGVHASGTRSLRRQASEAIGVAHGWAAQLCRQPTRSCPSIQHVWSDEMCSRPCTSWIRVASACRNHPIHPRSPPLPRTQGAPAVQAGVP
jgi:hypothetical protein